MRRRPKPKPPAPSPMEVYAQRRRVEDLLVEANELREAGVNLHRHSIMDQLAEVSGNPLAVYVFAGATDDVRLSRLELSEMAGTLCRNREAS